MQEFLGTAAAGGHRADAVSTNSAAHVVDELFRVGWAPAHPRPGNSRPGVFLPAGCHPPEWLFTSEYVAWLSRPHGRRRKYEAIRSGPGSEHPDRDGRGDAEDG